MLRCHFLSASPFALSPDHCHFFFRFPHYFSSIFAFSFFNPQPSLVSWQPFSPPPPLPTTPNPQFSLSMVLSLSLVIMVQITGSGEAPRLGRGGQQALQAGLCQQGRQPAAADPTQGEAAVSEDKIHKIHICLHPSKPPGWARRQQLETDLKIERQWRQTLRNELDREKDTVARLGTEAVQISALKKVKSRSRTVAAAPRLEASADACPLVPRPSRSSTDSRMKTFS